MASDDEAEFEFSDSTFGIFSLKLKEEPIPNHRIVNTYEYTVTGTANGGATGTVTGIMRVGESEFNCSMVNRPYSIDPIEVPPAGEETVIISENGSDYIIQADRNSECLQTYELELANGRAAPSYY